MATVSNRYVRGANVAVNAVQIVRRLRVSNDRGGASVLAIALIATVVMIGAVLVLGAATQAARVSAQHAADEAALAGARTARAQVALGEPVAEAACASAGSAAREHGAIVARCVAHAAVVTVDVELSRGPARAAARAVAGPAHATSLPPRDSDGSQGGPAL